ncbi:MAG: DMT family transporter [Ferrovibrio sp.]|uniref:DMT family transporter n=1 Tax=Ferrovibrio sp. TaxID=1917215 RepID=UPI00260F6E85|nr:DMT family transporter [Ferrovibrio sp.]MCW0232528.1 DMT family transporter [Ferrovibrio sp.]
MTRWLQAIWQRPYLLLWLPPAFWAGNLVLGRGLAETMPPVTLAVGRWLVALLLLLPFVAAQAWRQRALLWRQRGLILLCGGFGIAGYNALAYVALRSVPAVNVAFLNSTLPLMIPVAAFLLGREKVSRPTLLGIAVSFAGVCWIVSRGDVAALLALRFERADLLVLLAILNYALYSVLLRRRAAALDPFVFLAATMVSGLLVLLPFWLWELAAGATIPFDPASVAAVLYIGLFASLLAFILWNRCVAMLGATMTGVSFHLVAVFTAILAMLTLGEPVRSFHIAGIVLIIAGFALATWSASQRGRPA